MEDYAITLQSKLYKVNKKITQFKNIGLNVAKHEALLAKITENLGQETASYNDVTNMEPSFFKHSYIEAIVAVDKILSN